MNYLKHTAAIILKKRKIFLIQRSSAEDSEPNKWCPPNETLEKDELPEHAVVRGVKEEIGLDFSIIKKLPDHHFMNHITYVFLGKGKGKIIADSNEVGGFSWFTYQEAKKLCFAYDYQKVIDLLHQQNLI